MSNRSEVKLVDLPEDKVEELKKIDAEVEVDYIEKYKDCVILRNTSTHVFADLTPNGRKVRVEPGKEIVVPRSLSKWFIGDWENPLSPTQAEIKVIYDRNKHTEILLTPYEIEKDLSEENRESWKTHKSEAVLDYAERVKMLAQSDSPKVKINYPNPEVGDLSRVR